jgi:STE24 endopeptidase
MTPTILFYIIIGILITSFCFDTFLNSLNAKRFSNPIPKKLSDVYDKEAYHKSQAYSQTRYRFSKISGGFGFVVTLAFFLFDGFAWVDSFSRSYFENPITVALLFFGIIWLANELIGIPFSYYNTFVIEDAFGFNKTNITTFVTDKLKGWGITILFGGSVLAGLVWFYEISGPLFWLYAWGLITMISILINRFYAQLIVPLFNKQKPLEDGALRQAIEVYSKQVGFTLDNIFVIDGSKRSTKANAYFSGFGKQKRITLYDTLIEKLTVEEIVAVLAHEVGHYKKKHILSNLFLSTAQTGIMLFLLSLCVNMPLLSGALHVSIPSFHVGLIAFVILYTPLSQITGLGMNYLSRKYEYQADAYAKSTYAAEPLVSALKKLSKTSLSNLTPHPLYVKWHYSHPTLLQRIEKMDAKES